METAAKSDAGFNLQEYNSTVVERIVEDTLKATMKNPWESAFMLQFAAASRKATKTRLRLAEQGEHVPSFLIASITSQCNLHCAGCYSRCSEATVDSAPIRQLTGEEWLTVFREAEELGVSFILLAGGEPMLRRDVLEAAGTMRNILFPIFTNGTYINERALSLLDKRRNLVPVLSIEGGREITDTRRGQGVYDKLKADMEAFQKRGLFYGASVTITVENLREVVSADFLRDLTDRGCRFVIYVEYVPVTEDTRHLAPGDVERTYLRSAMDELRQMFPDTMLLSFPGDERASGGCMAAGRGFFHINSHGGAEPCPFSPYSDVNVRDTSLRNAMRSRLFRTLRDGGYLEDTHDGGCVLFEKRAQVEAAAHHDTQSGLA